MCHEIFKMGNKSFIKCGFEYLKWEIHFVSLIARHNSIYPGVPRSDRAREGKDSAWCWDFRLSGKK